MSIHSSLSQSTLAGCFSELRTCERRLTVPVDILASRATLWQEWGRGAVGTPITTDRHPCRASSCSRRNTYHIALLSYSPLLELIAQCLLQA